MRRLRSRRTVLWDAMGFSSARHSWMTALLASFLAMFVLVSVVEAATCVPEAVTAHTSEQVTDVPSDPDGADGLGQHAICGHGHCHHGAVATPSMSDDLTSTGRASDPAPLPPTDRLASRKPTGPDRPPRG
jgi:hypothetical protein